MIQQLRLDAFVNDMYTVRGSSGDVLILNLIDEDFSASGVQIKIQCLNIEFIDGITGIREICPNIIGIGTDKIRIFADDTNLYGMQITPDNIEQVKVEIYERRDR